MALITIERPRQLHHKRSAFFAVTVGTSVLSHAHRQGVLRELGIDADASRLPPTDPLQAELEKIAGDEAKLTKLVEFVEGDPRGRSAELNTIMGMLELHRGFYCTRFQYVYIKFYSSDTGAGLLSAKILESVNYSNLFKLVCGTVPEIVVDIVRVPGLGSNFEQGLHNLVITVARDLAEARCGGAYTVLVATGGYKPETAFATLAAYVAGVYAVYYIHEAFNKPVQLPYLPVSPSEPLLSFAREFPDAYRLAENLGVDVKHLESLGIIELDELGNYRPARWLIELLDVAERVRNCL